MSDRLEQAVEKCREIAGRVGPDCHDKAHDIRWCPTCESRKDGIVEFMDAITDPVLKELCEEIEACRHLSNIHEGMWLHAEEENDELSSINHSVAVCADHIDDMVGDGCLVCEIDRLKAELAQRTAMMDKRGMFMVEFKKE